MRLQVLGASGGLQKGCHTTALLVNGTTLIDAGTGLSELSAEALAAIDQVFLTHSHLDHIAALPLLLDTTFGMRDKALRVYGLPATLAAVQKHIFNGDIWPDFSALPSAASPCIRLAPLALGESVRLGELEVTVLPARHLVPCAGYLFGHRDGKLCFTGDTGPQEDLWRELARHDNLAGLIVECAFQESQKWLADLSGHLCPSLLAQEIAKLYNEVPLYISHLKPRDSATICAELRQYLPNRDFTVLTGGEVIHF